MSDSLERLNSDTFKQQLHTSFQVQAGNQSTIAMELIAVEEPPSAPGTELFCLHFRGPRSPRLPQKIWRFEHEKIRALDLFVTAIAGDENGIVYEAVFHRIRNKQA